MTRVVPDQKSKFESDELFRKLARESEVRYTGYRDRTHEERIVRFQTECREGRCPVAFTSSGTNLVLYLGPQHYKDKKEQPPREFVDFDKDPGKVHLKSTFVMNGVCVIFKGMMDLQRLDGTAYLELDNIQSKIEDKIMRDTIEQSRLRLQEFEERQRRVKQEPMENPDVVDYRSWQLSSAEAQYANPEYNPNMVFN
ncbi:core-binding factor subunit beta-like [Clytia hemisphaerica]|uniref:Uncharacterized protein n=1 Tax=Clytia hemisphaerica TaxID=252671 RepID=A0A7M5WKA5_9CNID